MDAVVLTEVVLTVEANLRNRYMLEKQVACHRYARPDIARERGKRGNAVQLSCITVVQDKRPPLTSGSSGLSVMYVNEEKPVCRVKLFYRLNSGAQDTEIRDRSAGSPAILV
ncbi:hypothetical protein PBNK5_03070 [Pectobacterium brasiliense]